ncbi:MAG: hypothetical protein KBT11_03170 [Treponema sp.]|nr:hypothetical protein [Candidatus Treponema equifaecale]
MKKNYFAFLIASVFAFAAYSEVKFKTIQIDNLYKLEYALDTDENSVVMKVYGENSVAFDEGYATDCITEELDSICSENDFDEGLLINSEKIAEYQDKYTLLTKKYYLK